MRLFIAIALSSAVKQRLQTIQKVFKPLGLMTCPDNIHLTLKYLGDAKPKEILTALKPVFLPRLTLEVDRLGVFGTLEAPRVLWAGLKQSQELFDLKKSIDSLIPRIHDLNEFKAHLTLARIRQVYSSKEFQNALQIPVDNLAFDVSSIALFNSKLSAEGAEYEVLGTFPAQSL